MATDPRARVAVTDIDLRQVTGARIDIEYGKNRRRGLPLALGTQTALAELHTGGYRGSPAEAARRIRDAAS